MKRHSNLSAVGAMIAITHVLLAIIGAVSVWQWLGGVVVGVLLVVARLLYVGVRGGAPKPDTDSA